MGLYDITGRLSYFLNALLWGWWQVSVVCMHVSMYLMDFVKTNRKVSVKVIVFHYFGLLFISHFPYCICWWFPWNEMRMAFCVYHKYIGMAVLTDTCTWKMAPNIEQEDPKDFRNELKSCQSMQIQRPKIGGLA